MRAPTVTLAPSGSAWTGVQVAEVAAVVQVAASGAPFKVSVRLARSSPRLSLYCSASAGGFPVTVLPLAGEVIWICGAVLSRFTVTLVVAVLPALSVAVPETV